MVEALYFHCHLQSTCIDGGAIGGGCTVLRLSHGIIITIVECVAVHLKLYKVMRQCDEYTGPGNRCWYI